MDKKKYVAYVGTYTHGNSVGIHLFDLNVENGTMKERKVIPINNPSYIKMSHNGKFLYSIADEGVRSFTVQPDGDLVPLNCASIEGIARRSTSRRISSRPKSFSIFICTPPPYETRPAVLFS